MRAGTGGFAFPGARAGRARRILGVALHPRREPWLRCRPKKPLSDVQETLCCIQGASLGYVAGACGGRSARGGCGVASKARALATLQGAGGSPGRAVRRVASKALALATLQGGHLRLPGLRLPRCIQGAGLGHVTGALPRPASPTSTALHPRREPWLRCRITLLPITPRATVLHPRREPWLRCRPTAVRAARM